MKIFLIQKTVHESDISFKEFICAIDASQFSKHNAIREFCSRNKFILDSVHFLENGDVEYFETTSGEKFEISTDDLIRNNLGNFRN